MRQGAREDGRLGGRLLVVRDEVDRLLVDVGEELLGDLGQAAQRKAAAQEPITGAAGQAALGLTRLLGLARGIVADSTAEAAKDFDAAASKSLAASAVESATMPLASPSSRVNPSAA